MAALIGDCTRPRRPQYGNSYYTGERRPVLIPNLNNPFNLHNPDGVNPNNIYGGVPIIIGPGLGTGIRMPLLPSIQLSPGPILAIP